VLQISGDGAPRRSQFPAIVAIALARIRPDPLARMHLKRRGARADHFPTLAPPVARRTDRIESTFGRRQCRIAGQRALPCGLACRIDVKDNVAAPLSIEDAANGFRGPPLSERMLLARAHGTLLSRDDPHRPRNDSSPIDGANIGVQTVP
jgi:hypothetical protein